VASFLGNTTGGGGVIQVATGIPAVRGYAEGQSPYFVYPYSLTGVTRANTGVPLPGCSVFVFSTADNSVAAITTSDGTGTYLVPASNAITHYAVAYLPGSPDVAGTTVDTLTGA
jgi:hypothetical protein